MKKRSIEKYRDMNKIKDPDNLYYPNFNPFQIKSDISVWNCEKQFYADDYKPPEYLNKHKFTFIDLLFEKHKIYKFL